MSLSSQGEKSDSSAGESATVLRGLLTSKAGGGLGRTAILRKYYSDLLEAERQNSKVQVNLLVHLKFSVSFSGSAG